MDLSIVLPTLRRADTAALIANRFGDLLGSSLAYEVIVVTPTIPAAAGVGQARFVRDAGGGVYAAYAQGIREAKGTYVWLLGDDDYPLDALAQLVPRLKQRDADMIVAPVIYSTGRLYKPRRGRFGLLFHNWCQQGVLYRTSLLTRHGFRRRLKVQADHYLNLLLRSDPTLRIAFVDDPLCVFGAHGLSSRGVDERFRFLRPRLARRTLSTPGFIMFSLIVAAADMRRRLRGSAR